MKVREVSSIDSLFKRLRSVSRDECEGAWRTLYEQNFEAIYRLVCSLGIEPFEAEDVVQRVFLVAYRRILEMVDVENPPAWIRGIAVKVVAEYRRWRKVRRLKQWLLKSSEEAGAVRAASPERMIIVDETQACVHKILAKMNPKLSAALILHELEDHSLEEVAQILAVPVNTVRSRKRLARQEFERLWMKYYRGEEDHG